jgi:hypothetical protein
MIQAVREITKWDVVGNINHTYLIEGDKMLAYIKVGTAQPQYFSKPITFDRRYRKFETVTPNPFGEVKNDDVVEVTGSGGKVYYVDLHKSTCTCSGFRFRGKCKHIQQAMEMVSNV